MDGPYRFHAIDFTGGIVLNTRKPKTGLGPDVEPDPDVEPGAIMVFKLVFRIRHIRFHRVKRMSQSFAVRSRLWFIVKQLSQLVVRVLSVFCRRGTIEGNIEGNRSVLLRND